MKSLCSYKVSLYRVCTCMWSTSREYLVDESRDKKGVGLDVTGWSSSTPRDIPHQRNGSDCGVFTCMVSS